eukprot:15366559-Ditylum_brightwellii.AAC.2
MKEEYGNNVIQQVCGSNLDKFGNPYFIDTIEPYGHPHMKNGVFVERWTDIVYSPIDAWYTMLTIFLFGIIVVIGDYIVLHHVLAVITSFFNNHDKTEGNAHQIDRNKRRPLQNKALSGLTAAMMRSLKANITPVSSYFVLY